MCPEGSSPAPRVTVHSLEGDGVVLVSSANPAFDPHLAPEYAAILPYTVVVTNNSPQPILAYGVVWRYTDAVGKPLVRVRNVFSGMRLDPGKGLAPGRGNAVSPVLALEAGGGAWNAMIGPEVARVAGQYTAATRVDISLDSVLFADGTAVGPDTANLIVHWKGWIDAERDVLTVVAENPSASLVADLGRIADAGAFLVAQGTGAGRPGTVEMASRADRAKTYAECYILAKAYFAQSTVEEIERGGSPTVENLLHVRQLRVYPDVRRKDQN
jgi:hypothetical protein